MYKFSVVISHVNEPTSDAPQKPWSFEDTSTVLPVKVKVCDVAYAVNYQVILLDEHIDRFYENIAKMKINLNDAYNESYEINEMRWK